MQAQFQALQTIIRTQSKHGKITYSERPIKFKFYPNLKPWADHNF